MSQEKPADKQDHAEKTPLEDRNTAQGAQQDDTGGMDDFALPQLTFSTFVFSLNTSCLVHLGLMEDPSTGQKTKNLPLAKQTIDVIAMLEEKTRGNLTSDEETMVKNILYDLCISYVREKG